MNQINNPVAHTLTYYSPFVPHAVDIENRIADQIHEIRESNEERKISDGKRIDKIEKDLKELQEKFTRTVQIRCCDGIIGTVLLIVIYVKVFVGFH
jgi:hypothetical protein